MQEGCSRPPAREIAAPCGSKSIGITKRFPGVVANEDVSLTFEPGEVHALLGENAGKSTLMNVLFELYQPDEGEVLVDGEPVHFKGPTDAIAAGIGMVHQHFKLVPVFTVAENVMLGNERTKAMGFLDRGLGAMVEDSRRVRLAVDPGAVIEDLPVGIQQRGDHQGADPGRPLPHPRRTDGGPHAERDRGAAGDRAPATVRRPGHRVHHSQAPRGLAVADRISVLRRYARRHGRPEDGPAPAIWRT